jgi:hypothetical protein
LGDGSTWKDCLFSALRGWLYLAGLPLLCLGGWLYLEGLPLLCLGSAHRKPGIIKIYYFYLETLTFN